MNLQSEVCNLQSPGTTFAPSRPEGSMKLTSLGPVLLALTLVAVPASAQSDVTSADIQRLQDTIYDASRDIAQARGRDGALGSQLETELDEARDEATYLRVKLRKHEPIAGSEYLDLRERIENIRSRARGDSTGGYTPPPSRPSAEDPWPDRRSTDDRRSTPTPSPTPTIGRSQSDDDVPVGTEFDIRLQNSLSSATAQVEDRFEATTLVDLRDPDGRVVVPAGSVMRGVVSGVTKAGRLERKGAMTVAFDRVTIRGRAYPIRATVTQALESEGIMGEKERIGIGAGAGAILGAILGGAKGALAGILIGGGGTIAATEGKDVDLPQGTVLRVRMDAPLNLQRR
jgi:hypothetical protein